MTQNLPQNKKNPGGAEIIWPPGVGRFFEIKSILRYLEHRTLNNLSYLKKNSGLHEEATLVTG